MKNIGYGKTILFGEHFVVYGLPSIASAISNYTEAKIEPASGGEQFIPGVELVDERPATPGYKEKKRGEMERSLKLILDFMKIDTQKNPLKITLSGNLKCASGIGASAAMASSIARALSEKFGKNLDDDKINEVAYEGEKGSAGNPSGIDNTASTYGGLLIFEKNLEGGKNMIERLSIEKPIEIVVINSGVTQETKEVVADVRKFKEENEKRFAEICGEYKKVFERGLQALKTGDVQKLGQAIEKNQVLLKQITVSSELIDEIVSKAKRAGAIAAKLTGTGRGGLVIALTPGKELQEKVAKEMQEAGFETTKTSIG
jgi:mevalonate kinase